MAEPVYIVKYSYNNIYNGPTNLFSIHSTIKSAIYYFIDLDVSNLCIDNSFKKSIHKIVCDETNEIKELVMENL